MWKEEKQMIFRSKCRYCGKVIADRSLAKHIEDEHQNQGYPTPPKE